MSHLHLQQKSLADHNIRIIFWATIFGSINFLEPIMTLLYLQTGLSLADVFWVTLCWCLSVLIFEVPTGAFADRYGAKASFIVGCTISILSKGLVIGSVLTQEAWMFYLYNILWGISVTFFSGAEEALLYDSLKESGKEDTMDAVMGKMQSASMYPLIITFLVGPFVAKDLAPSQFVLLTTVWIVLQLVQLFLLFKVINPKSHSDFRENPFVHVKAGLNNIRKQPALIRLFVHFTIIFVASFVVFGKMEQPFLIESGLKVEWLGVLYAALSLLGLFVSNHIGWLTKRFSRIALLYVSGILTLVGVVIASQNGGSMWIALGVFLVIRLARMIRYPIYSHLQNEYIPSESRATTLSLLSIFDSVFDVIFLVSFASIASLGFNVVFTGCAIAVVIGLLIPIRAAKPDEKPNVSNVNEEVNAM